MAVAQRLPSPMPDDIANERTQLLVRHDLDAPVQRHPLRRTLYRAGLFFTSAVSFVWLILLIINTFTHIALFSPPSAFAFAFTCLALGCSLHALVFFNTPTPLRLAWILPALLAFDILLFVSPATRQQLRGVGIISLVWSLFTAFFMVGHAVIVQAEEEEFEEDREIVMSAQHWAIRYLSIFTSSLSSMCLNVIALLITFNLILSVRDYAVFPAAGTVYRVSSTQSVHLFCSDWQVGHSSSFNSTKNGDIPTILLEAGDTPSEVGLAQWAEENNDSFRYCLWDRPGYAYSSLASSPHSAGASADALSSALSLAGEHGPWIIMSAGKGTIVSRIFASRNSGLITGLVLLDPLHEELLSSRLSRPFRSMGLFIQAYLSPLGLSRLGGLVFHSRSGLDRILGPSSLQTSNSLLAELQESLSGSKSRKEVVIARVIQRKNTPLAIVSSSQMMKNTEWAAGQKDLTTLTDRLVGWHVVDAPHEVWKREEGRRAMTASVKKIIKKA